jgi:hypothetical protein
MDDMFNESRGFQGFWALKLREALGGSYENERGGDEEGFKGFLYAACCEEGVRVFQEKSGGKQKCVFQLPLLGLSVEGQVHRLYSGPLFTFLMYSRSI